MLARLTAPAAALAVSWTLAASLILATAALAGPCPPCTSPTGDPVSLGWWDDRPLSSVGAEAASPRIDVEGRRNTTTLSVVWEDRSSGDGDLVLALSADGCTWSEMAITTGAGDDRFPDVAVAPAEDPALTRFAIVFVRDGSTLLVTTSTDGGASFSTPELLGAADEDTRPRVAGITVDTVHHFHAAWTAGGAMHVARNLSDGQAGQWDVSPSWSDAFAGYLRWTGVDITADTRSSEPGTHSAVSVAASAIPDDGIGAERVVVIRSPDSGATFFGDPLDALSVDTPRRLDDTGGEAFDPLIDTNDDAAGIFFAWNTVAWTTSGIAGLSTLTDARAEENAGPTIISDWNDPPDARDVSFGPGATVALSVLPNPFDRPPDPIVHVFARQATEIEASRGSLEQFERPSVVPWCGPYTLTGVSPPRTAGIIELGSFSADEDRSHVYVVWTDTRDGAGRIYFKRTDTLVDEPLDVTVTPTGCGIGPGVSVAWELVEACDLEHLRIDVGTTVGGDDLASTQVPPDLVGETPVLGLPEDTDVHVTVTVVDEACNEAAHASVPARTAACTIPDCPNPVDWSLRASEADERHVDLTWEPPPVTPGTGAATSYDVYRSERAPAGFALVANTPMSSYRDTDATLVGTPPRFFYLIVARNACGTSGDEPLP